MAGAAGVGLLLGTGGNGGVVMAETRIPSGIASLLIAVSPLLVALISLALFRVAIRRVQGAGMVLGFAGLAVLAQLGGPGGLDPIGLAFGLAGAVLWSAGAVYGSRAHLPESDLVNTGIQLVAGGLGLLLAGMIAGEPARMRLDHASAQSVGGLIYLIVFGSVIAYSAFTWLLRNGPLPLVFTYVYVNPVVAVGLGALILGEQIGLRELLGGAIILAGVATIVTGRALAERLRPAA